VSGESGNLGLANEKFADEQRQVHELVSEKPAEVPLCSLSPQRVCERCCVDV
jgi:hypothetical protein